MSICSCYTYPVLQSKFDNFILNSSCEEAEKKFIFESLQSIFKSVYHISSFKELGFECLGFRAHVLKHSQLPGYLFKVKRLDGVQICQDQHLYRVTRAEKIRTYIQKNGLKNIIVPKKYLYPYMMNGVKEWMVVTECFNLSSSLIHSIDPLMARNLGKLIVDTGLRDIVDRNIPFTSDGKIVLLDTESLDRHELKNVVRAPISMLDLKQKIKSYAIRQSLDNLEKLCLNPKARRRVKWIKHAYDLKNHMRQTALTYLVGIIYVISSAYFAKERGVYQLCNIAISCLALMLAFRHSAEFYNGVYATLNPTQHGKLLSASENQ